MMPETLHSVIVLLSPAERATLLDTFSSRLTHLQSELAQTHDRANRAAVARRIHALVALSGRMGISAAELNA